MERNEKVGIVTSLILGIILQRCMINAQNHFSEASTCATNPCDNSSWCKDDVSSVECPCRPGFYASTPSVCEPGLVFGGILFLAKESNEANVRNYLNFAFKTTNGYIRVNVFQSVSDSNQWNYDIVYGIDSGATHGNISNWFSEYMSSDVGCDLENTICIAPLENTAILFVKVEESIVNAGIPSELVCTSIADYCDVTTTTCKNVEGFATCQCLDDFEKSDETDRSCSNANSTVSQTTIPEKFYSTAAQTETTGRMENSTLGPEVQSTSVTNPITTSTKAAELLTTSSDLRSTVETQQRTTLSMEVSTAGIATQPTQATTDLVTTEEVTHRIEPTYETSNSVISSTQTGIAAQSTPETAAVVTTEEVTHSIEPTDESSNSAIPSSQTGASTTDIDKTSTSKSENSLSTAPALVLTSTESEESTAGIATQPTANILVTTEEVTHRIEPTYETSNSAIPSTQTGIAAQSTPGTAAVVATEEVTHSIEPTDQSSNSATPSTQTGANTTDIDKTSTSKSENSLSTVPALVLTSTESEESTAGIATQSTSGTAAVVTTEEVTHSIETTDESSNSAIPSTQTGASATDIDKTSTSKSENSLSTAPALVLTSTESEESTTGVITCETKPCKSQGSWCKNSNGNITCPCKPGFYASESSSCTPGLVFGGSLFLLNENPSESAIQLFLESSFEESEGFSAISNLTKDDDLLWSYNLLYETYSEVDQDDIMFSISAYLQTEKKCNVNSATCIVSVAVQEAFTKSKELLIINPKASIKASGVPSETVCLSVDGYCDADSTECQNVNGLATCNCSEGYVSVRGADGFCAKKVCSVNKECNHPFGYCHPETNENAGICKCLFGFEGTNCQSPWLFVVVTAGSGLLLITIILMSIVLFRKPEKSSKATKTNSFHQDRFEMHESDMTRYVNERLRANSPHSKKVDSNQARRSKRNHNRINPQSF